MLATGGQAFQYVGLEKPTLHLHLIGVTQFPMANFSRDYKLLILDSIVLCVFGLLSLIHLENGDLQWSLKSPSKVTGSLQISLVQYYYTSQYHLFTLIERHQYRDQVHRFDSIH